jgi:hypothetical protein
MPRGDKSSYTNKQKRQAEHIEEGYEQRGIAEKEAAHRARATVNKQDHGGEKSGLRCWTPERYRLVAAKAVASEVARPQAGPALNDPDQRKRLPRRARPG